MNQEKIFISNQDGEKICLLIERSANPRGLAIIMHGLGGFKEQDHITTFAESFKEHAFTVVRFDTRNTFGESEGSYENANTSNYYDDLESVVDYLKQQPWYQSPFYLVGHSTGALCVALYAQRHPNEIKGLAPISTVVSGKLTLEREPQDRLMEWNSTGWKISPSASKPGVIKKLRWHQYVDDVKKYNLLKDVEALTMPVLLMTGDQDRGTPVEDHQLLFDHLPGDKEFHIIKGAPHTFRESDHLRQIKTIFDQWIRRIELV